MKKRLKLKIAKRLTDYDDLLNQYYYRGGLRLHRQGIVLVRRMIQYLRRRWPAAYFEAFDTDFDIGHWSEGR